MSPDGVHADPKDVRKLARALEQFEQQVMQVSKQGRKAIDQANWHDSQKEQFARRYDDFQRRTTSFVGGEVKQMIKSLNLLAGDLERAQSRRF